jgi:hypothetical protein
MKRIIVIILMALTVNFIQGQPLTGIKTIPGDYPTIATAVAALNLQGTAAPGVTFNIVSGYTENGLNIILNTNTSSVTAPVVFQKVPGGAVNPKLFVAGGGVYSATDGGVIIAGSDYVTFDGIDIKVLDNTIDWGYAMVKKNSTAPFDGCQHVTIKNCSISMSRGNGYAYGIYSGNHIATSTSVLTITSATDACSNCKFFNNNISDVFYGISLTGYNASSPYSLYDQGNEIGVEGGNFITNFGGTFSPVAIYAIYQNSITISNNNISNGTVTVAPGYSIYGISLTGGSQSSGTISNNTISISLTTGTSQGFYGIYTQFGNSGTTNTLNITNNIIQNCSYPTATTAEFYGIYNAVTNTGPGTINVNNNVIHDITLGGNGLFYGINAGSALNINMNNNTIYNLSATGSASLYALRSNTGTTIVHDNIVHDLSVGSGNNLLSALYEWGSPTVESYYNNLFYNLNHGGTGTVYGMALNTNTGTRQTYSNTIHTLASNGGPVYGMWQQSSTPTVYKNSIYDLTSQSANGLVNGIYFTNSSTANVYNNSISDLKTPSSTGTNAISGIYLNGVPTANLSYNTIYMNATSSSTTTFGTSGIYALSNYTIELKNNIIINTSTPVFTGGAAYTTALQRSASSLTNFTTSSNNNCYYSGIPGPNRLIHYDGTNADQSISLYKTRVTPRETASFTELPPFIDPANHNLHISPSVPTMIESSGSRITTPVAIVNDADGNIRWGETGYAGTGTATDIGAYEGNYTPMAPMNFGAATTDQVTGNTFSGTINQAVIRVKISVDGAFAPVNVTQFTCNAAGSTMITDINATPSKIYYTGNSSFYGPGMLFGSTLPTIGNYVVTGSQTLTPGDNYFWLVYDIIQTAQTGHLIDGQCVNVTVGGAVRVPVITSPAGNLMILGPMSGTYLVGAGNVYPNFTTITDAVNNINHRGNGGPVTFSLTNQHSVPYNSSNGEVFPIIAGEIPLASAINTTTIQPASGMSPLISGSSATSIINLNGTDYFIFNGSNNGSTSRDLTIENLNTANSTAALQISSLGTGAGATYCTVKNCIIRGGSTGAGNNQTYALSVGSTVGSQGRDNNFMTIDNNEFSRAYYALYIAGSTWGFQTNLTVSNNTIGSDSANFFIGNTGVYLNNTLGMFSNNVIKGVISPLIATWGLYIGPGVKNMVFTKNDIHAIRGSSDFNGGTGIFVDLASAGGNVTIANNVIYDITGAGSSNLQSYGTAGIKITGYTTDLKLYYNSINLSGTFSNNLASGYLSTAIFVGGSVAQIDMRNNIFSNSMENLTGDSKAYAIYCAGTSAAFTNLDNNDYKVGGMEGVLASYNGTDKTTLGAWQASSGKDANSLASDPNFNDPFVLIPYPGSSVLDKCPALPVTDDYTGTVRAVPTSMGAYEAGNDLTPPVVTYKPFYNTHLLTPRTLVTTIKDYFSTVPTSGSGLPRLYWKINNNPYNIVTGTWTSGNTYQFTFGGGVAPGNTVSYFIVCQDEMPVPNAGVTPSAGASGISKTPPACTTPPSSPSTYSIVGSLSGVKNIPGDYPTLTGANGFFADMNSKALSGDLTVKIVGDVPSEPGINALNEINTEDPNYKVTITNSGSYHKVSGAYAGALIRFNGVDNLVVNGKGKLFFQNQISNSSTACELTGGCDNNIIDSCKFACGSNLYPGNCGISFTGAGNNNKFRNDSITAAYTGIYINSSYWGLGTGNIISGNIIGSSSLNTYVSNNGIIAMFEDNLMISKNHIFNVISNNSPRGIYTEAVTNSIIEKNDIHDVYYNGVNYTGAAGITIKSLTTSPNIMIRNNIIRHLAGMGSSPNTLDNNTIPAGIKLFGNATGGISIYNNSVYMPRDLSYGVFYNNEWFTALEIGAGISGIVLKNNILQNSVGEWPNSNLTSWGYAIYTKGAVSPFASINNNLYYTSNYDNNFVGLNGIAVPPVNNMNLDAWKTFTSQDAQSLNTDPLFTSATNLTPLPLSPAIGAGLSCPGVVDDDILGNARGTSTTIGAYEMVSATTKTLNLSFLLQGQYLGSGNMRAASDNSGPHWGSEIADHLTIELHDATPGNYANIIYTASDVALSTNGMAAAFIPAGLSGTYYITIRHRNGLSTVSATPVSFSGSIINYTFDAPAKALGNKLVQLPGGGYGIYSGDVNQDGYINIADMELTGTGSNGFATGYLQRDVNGDGTIDSGDMTFIDNNSGNAVSFPSSPLGGQDFSISIKNVTQTSDRTLEFDLYLLDTDPAQPFELASVQCGINVNPLIYTGGTFSASLVPGTSDVNPSQVPGYVTYTTGTGANIIKLSAVSPPGSGNGTILSTVSPGTRLVRIKLTSTVSFPANSLSDLTFTFSSAVVPSYATRVAIYQAGINAQLEVTPGVNSFVSGNPLLNPSFPVAYNVTGGGTCCDNSGGLPVGISGSQVGVTYTLFKNDVQVNPTISGTGSAIYFPGNQTAGNYTVSGTNAYGSSPMLNSVMVLMNPSPVAVIGSNSPICVGSTLLLTGGPASMVSYQWSGPNGFNSSLQNPSIINATTYATGTYTLTVTNAIGCAATPAIGVVVHALPVPVITGPVSACSGSTGINYTTEASMTGYSWTVTGGSITSGGNTNSISVSWGAVGTGQVSVTYSIASLCQAAVPTALNVVISPVPVTQRYLNNINVIDGASMCADALQTIFVAGSGTSFMVSPGGTSHLVAGQNVILYPGTTVKEGGYLHAYIANDCLYCTSPKSTVVSISVDSVSKHETSATTIGNELFKVYPNPTSGKFTLEILRQGEATTAHVDLFGMQGKLVTKMELNNISSQTFDLGNYPSGLYFIRVLIGNEERTARILKF